MLFVLAQERQQALALALVLALEIFQLLVLVLVLVLELLPLPLLVLVLVLVLLQIMLTMLVMMWAKVDFWQNLVLRFIQTSLFKATKQNCLLKTQTHIWKIFNTINIYSDGHYLFREEKIGVGIGFFSSSMCLVFVFCLLIPCFAKFLEKR